MGRGSGGLGSGEGKERMGDRQCEWGRQCRAWERQRTHTHTTHTHTRQCSSTTRACKQIAHCVSNIEYRNLCTAHCILRTDVCLSYLPPHDAADFGAGPPVEAPHVAAAGGGRPIRHAGVARGTGHGIMHRVLLQGAQKLLHVFACGFGGIGVVGVEYVVGAGGAGRFRR